MRTNVTLDVQRGQPYAYWRAPCYPVGTFFKDKYGAVYIKTGWDGALFLTSLGTGKNHNDFDQVYLIKRVVITEDV